LEISPKLFVALIATFAGILGYAVFLVWNNWFYIHKGWSSFKHYSPFDQKI